MKKTAENRYPHSATLFKFCKEALEIRYEGNVKVIDQDVGAILGYDPADCSHWKKGKKNIRALATLRGIADHLNLDERLLIDIASGKIDLDEAVFEYKGYGHFSLQGPNLEGLKKEFFKNPSRWQNDGRGRSFEELFDVDRDTVARMAYDILNAGNFAEAPIYIPEILQLFPNITLKADESLGDCFEVVTNGEGKGLTMTMTYRGPEMRPYVRFLAAKHLFRYLCQAQPDASARLGQAPDEVAEVRANLFAGMLLIPGPILRREVDRINSSLDIVLQLSETFWISKALMNQRLRDYMDYLN